jgi:hypothetical protein
MQVKAVLEEAELAPLHAATAAGGSKLEVVAVLSAGHT